MKIAILSDIHDNIWNLEKVLIQLKKLDLEAIIFCGDFCSPFIPPKLTSLNIKVYACLGNNDRDLININKTGGKKLILTSPSESFGEVTIDKRKIAFSHYPSLAELLAKSGNYDAIFHGHTHESKNEKYGKTLLINP